MSIRAHAQSATATGRSWRLRQHTEDHADKDVHDAVHRANAFATRVGRHVARRTDAPGADHVVLASATNADHAGSMPDRFKSSVQPGDHQRGKRGVCWTYSRLSTYRSNTGGCHLLREVWSLRYNAGILSKNGGHHAIPHRKQPLEMIFSNFFQKSIFPLHT